MSLDKIIVDRGIKSVVHFTTNRGSLGVFRTKALKSRHRLNGDEQLKHIFQPNAASRDKDADWLDYANLSISRINTDFFGASGNWHKEKDFFWCILDFSHEILSHHGVQFTTTNNIYTGVNRGKGAEALEATFNSVICQWSGRLVRRPESYPLYLPTCRQAEVLYPGEVSTEYLQKIYVREESDGDELVGQMELVRHREIEIEVKPEFFREIK